MTTPALQLWRAPVLNGTLRFGPERRFQLLAVLGLQAGQWVERDRLAALLWPERDSSQARRNLRKVVFDAHELPGLDGLDSDAHALRWTVDSDVAAFHAQRSTDPAAALDWRQGLPLAGIDDARNAAFAEWLAAERARLEQAWQVTAAAALASAQDPSRQAALARRMLEIDALDEVAMHALLRAELAQGQVAQAQAAYRRYATALGQQLGVEPSRALRELLAAPPAPPSRAASPSPSLSPLHPPGAADGSFIGRRLERTELQRLLAQPECRLLTVLGPGGVGKSSLARQAMQDSAALFGQRSAWVPLQDAQQAAELPARLAQALGMTLTDGPQPLTSLIQRWLAGDEGRALLVLDNAEHLLQGAAPGSSLLPALAEALAAAPGLVLLLTSRARCAMPAEWLLPLHGLSVPDEDSRDLEAASAFDAVRMFEQRSVLARRNFVLAEHLDAVVAICEAVDGLPLAIELAASWVRLLPPKTIAADIAQGASQALDLLERDPAAPGDPARADHASLRAVLQGSWRLLGAAEQRTLAALAVFHGGFTRAAARAVVGCPLPLLSALADASLLAVEADSGRFSMHPVVQRFASERLDEDAPRRAELAERHAAHFTQQLAAWAPLMRTQPQQLARQMVSEEANARAAWSHALQGAHAARLLQMLPAWRTLFETNGRFDDGLALLRALLALPEVDADATRLLTHVRQVMCALLYQRGRAAEALMFAEAGIESALRCGERMPLKGCLNTASLSLWLLGRTEEALQQARRMHDACEADGDRYGIVVALSTAAISARSLGHFEESLADLQRALAIAQELGNPAQIGHLHNMLGNHHRTLAKWSEARASFETGLRHAQQHGLAAAVSFCGVNLGLVEIELGEIERAHGRLTALLDRQAEVPQQQVALDAELGLARIHIRRGERAALRERLRRVEAVARPAGLQPRLLQALQVWAEALRHEGRAAEGVPLMRWLAEHPEHDMSGRLAARRDLEAAGAARPAADEVAWSLDLEASIARMRADTG